MQRISWTAGKRYKEVLSQVNDIKSLLQNIRIGQNKYLGHEIRKRKLEHLFPTGKIDGKRAQVKQFNHKMEIIIHNLYDREKLATFTHEAVDAWFWQDK